MFRFSFLLPWAGAVTLLTARIQVEMKGREDTEGLNALEVTIFGCAEFDTVMEHQWTNGQTSRREISSTIHACFFFLLTMSLTSSAPCLPSTKSGLDMSTKA